MEYITAALIGLGLAMDAFAVSIVSGAGFRKLKLKHIFRMAFFFGGFQALMPLAGYLAARSITVYIESYDHWVAFGLLGFVGGKMIYESLVMKGADDKFDLSSITALLVLSFATSIDAFAIGITLSLLMSSLITAVIIIGLITFVLSCIGAYIGRRFGHFFENKVEAVGGLILVGLGVKILIEHLSG